MTDREHTQLKDCAAVIAAFGGIRPMAHKLDVPVSTVQGWKQRDAIPENRTADIIAAAEAHNVDLSKIAAAPESRKPAAEPAAEAAEPPATPSTTKRSREPGQWRGDRVATAVAAIALVVAIAAGAWSVFGARQPANGTDLSGINARLAALEAAPRPADSAALERRFAADLAELRSAVDRIARKQQEFGTPRADIDRLAARLDKAETELGRLEKAQSELERVQRQSADTATATAAAALSAAKDDIKADIDELRGQITALGNARSAAGENITGAVGLALAAGRLQRAIDRGEAYQDVVAGLRALAAGDAAIGAVLDRLAAHAATGVPRHDALLRAFPGVARAVVGAADAEAATSWTQRMLQRIRNTVSIRRIGADITGDAPGARVARAEAKLADGDLGGAIAELDGLTGAAATAAAAWLADARARHDAVTAVGALETLAMARLHADTDGS